jgi:hypothetical protein
MSGGHYCIEHYSMARRVDRVEQSVTTSIVKIDAAIYKLENVDRIKNTHRHRMTAITAEIDSVRSTELYLHPQTFCSKTRPTARSI